MKRLMIMSIAAVALALAPLGLQPQANEAHHTGNATKVKKSKGTKPKQTKKPPTKVDKSSRPEGWKTADAVTG